MGNKKEKHCICMHACMLVCLWADQLTVVNITYSLSSLCNCFPISHFSLALSNGTERKSASSWHFIPCVPFPWEIKKYRGTNQTEERPFPSSSLCPLTTASVCVCLCLQFLLNHEQRMFNFSEIFFRSSFLSLLFYFFLFHQNSWISLVFGQVCISRWYCWLCIYAYTMAI